MAGVSNVDTNLTVAQPNQMSLGDLVNLGRSVQAYQQAQQINPLQVQQQQAETQVAQETAAPKISAAKSTATKLELEAQQAGVDLKQHYSNVERSLLGGFVTDPDFVNGNADAMVQKLTGAQDYAKNVLKLPDDVVNSANKLVDLAKDNPQQAYQTIKNGVTASQAAQTQQQLITPQGSTNIYGQAIGVNPATGQIGTLGGENTNVNPKNTLGTYSKDLYGNPVFIPNTPQGGVGNPQAIGGNQQQNPTMALPSGETQESLNYVTKLRNDAAQAAKSVPQQQYYNNQVIKLADVTDTGTGAQIIRNLGGGFAAIPWTTDSAANFDKLGHYIAANSIQLAQQAGLGTDAGRALNEEASGSKTFTKESLKSVARTNRALSSGIDLFNRGADNSIKLSGNPFAARDFQNQWSQTVDINALRLYDSMVNKDNAGIAEVVKDVGGIKSQGYKDLKLRMEKMRQLIQGQ